MDAITINNLHLKRNEFELCIDDFHLPLGTVTGLIGRNGAGKTTLIHALAFSLDYTGQILYRNFDGRKDEVESKKQMGFILDKPLFNSQLKLRKIKSTYQKIYPSFDIPLYDSLCKKFELTRQNIRFSELSLGQQKKFNFIITFCQHPQTLILDEPTANIDPADRYEIIDLLQEYMLDERHTILYSSHITSDLEKMSDYIAFIEDGEIILNSELSLLEDEFIIVQTDESQLNQCSKIIEGYKESASGFECLIYRDHLHFFSQANYRKATLEDILVFKTRKGV